MDTPTEWEDGQLDTDCLRKMQGSARMPSADIRPQAGDAVKGLKIENSHQQRQYGQKKHTNGKENKSSLGANTAPIKKENRLGS